GPENPRSAPFLCQPIGERRRLAAVDRRAAWSFEPAHHGQIFTLVLRPAAEGDGESRRDCRGRRERQAGQADREAPAAAAMKKRKPTGARALDIARDLPEVEKNFEQIEKNFEQIEQAHAK